MALTLPVGFCHSVSRYLRITGVPDAPLERRLCVKPVLDENASSSSFSAQEPSRLLLMELSNETWKWSRDLTPLPSEFLQKNLRIFFDFFIVLIRCILILLMLSDLVDTRNEFAWDFLCLSYC